MHTLSHLQTIKMPHPPTLCLRSVYFTVSNCIGGMVTQDCMVRGEVWDIHWAVTFRQRGTPSPCLSRYEPVTHASVTPVTEVSMLSSWRPLKSELFFAAVACRIHSMTPWKRHWLSAGVPGTLPLPPSSDTEAGILAVSGLHWMVRNTRERRTSLLSSKKKKKKTVS